MSTNELIQHHLDRRTVLAGTGVAVAGGVLATRFAPDSRAQTEDATPGTGATPELSGGVEVDPQMQQLLDALAATEAPPIENVTPQIARNLPSIASATLAVTAANGEPGQEEIGGISHILVPGEDGDLVARVYTPVDAPDGPLPVAIYFHGGGFVIANLDTYDASCRAVSNAAGCLVVSVAYRQAPENPYPAAVSDAYAATQYVIENAGLINGDPERVAVIGESAGGNLATVVCQLARDLDGVLPVHQVLVYPVATFAPTGDQTESIDQFATAAPLNSAMLEWFGSYYLPDPTVAESDPYVSPAIADLTGLPPATVILAEIAPLFSQGEIYAQQLTDAGIDTTVTTYTVVTHEFFGTGAIVDQAVEAVEEVAGRLREAFATS